MIRMATPRDAAGIHAIYAPIVLEDDEGIALPNAASLALHESVDFTPLGVIATSATSSGRGATPDGGNAPLASCPRTPRSRGRCRSSRATFSRRR